MVRACVINEVTAPMSCNGAAAWIATISTWNCRPMLTPNKPIIAASSQIGVCELTKTKLNMSRPPIAIAATGIHL